MPDANAASAPDDAEAAAVLPADKRPRPAGSVRQYWSLSGGYWRGPTRRQAWALTIATIALVVANIAIQYGVNRWNKFFFNAMERKDSDVVLTAIGVFAVLAIASSAVAVG